MVQIQHHSYNAHSMTIIQQHFIDTYCKFYCILDKLDNQ